MPTFLTIWQFAACACFVWAFFAVGFLRDDPAPSAALRAAVWVAPGLGLFLWYFPANFSPVETATGSVNRLEYVKPAYHALGGTSPGYFQFQVDGGMRSSPELHEFIEVGGSFHHHVIANGDRVSVVYRRWSDEVIGVATASWNWRDDTVSQSSLAMFGGLALILTGLVHGLRGRRGAAPTSGTS